MNQRSCNLADCWQELITRCGFSVSIDERGVHVSENCTNGRHGSFPDGITAVSAYHLEIIENMQERFFVLLAERDAALAKETKEVMQHAVTEFERDAALQEVERLKAPVSDVRIQALKDAIVAQCDNGKDCPGPEKDHGIGDFFSRCSAYRLWKLLNKEHIIEQEAELSRLKAQLEKPWEHSEHWRNPESGQVECECCCSWALDAERTHKTIERLKAPVSDEEWGKGRHLANRSHVNEIIANRSKQEKA